MLDPKRFSPTGTVDKRTGKDALLRTKLSFQQMVDNLDNYINEQLVSLAKNDPRHIHPSSFPKISAYYVKETFEINTWFLANPKIKPTVLPPTHNMVVSLESKYNERERLQQELNKVENEITNYESKTNDDDRKKVVENYYKDGSIFFKENDRINKNIDKMEKNDIAMDKLIAAKNANPNQVVRNAIRNVRLNHKANRQAVLRGRKLRAEAEQKVVDLSHDLMVQKYHKKSAEFEAKRDAALSQKNSEMADVYQAKIDNIQNKINKPINSWGSTKILLKERAIAAIKLRKSDNISNWRVRRANALQDKVDGGKTL